MNDPRFEKLPKWAQEQYRADMKALRVTAALRWPTEAKPVPVIAGVGYGQTVGEHDGWAWAAGVSQYGGIEVSNEFIRKGRGYRDEDCRGEGSSIHRTYYATEREAVLAARWKFCESVAEALAEIDRRLAE